jgi:hypothetical protein
MLIKYQISNKFLTSTAQTTTVSGTTFNLSKSIVLPISTEFYPVDYGEDVQDIVVAERKKAIGEPFDAETVKYLYPNPTINNNNGLMIQFRFWNTTSNTYTTSYDAAEFSTLDISKNRNPFKKSFFRLYFYDSNTGETSNLIFTEDLNVYGTTTPMIPLNRIYWLRNDKDFIGNTNNKTIYMNASFFNAKTGKIHRFINTNVIGPPNFVNTPIDIQQYSDPANREWRTSAVTILNPRGNNGLYNFVPVIPFGANQISIITLSEFTMI